MPGPNEFVFDSIGSRFWLERLDGGKFDEALKAEILSYAQTYDNNYSRFKDSSLVMQLARDGELMCPISELCSMLETAKDMYELSEGVFNITVGAALHKMGYGKRKHAGSVLVNPWEKITWDADKLTCPKGLVLDFGGLGKGWMIDGIAAILNGHGVPQYIVNGGGDLYAKAAEPIGIALENPLMPGTMLQQIALQNGALAGSDTLKRTWHTGDVKKHHIIDPRTEDSSSSGIIACYVTAETALTADMAATVLLIRPELKPKLEAALGIHALLISAPTN